MFSAIGLTPSRCFWGVFIILAVWLQLFFSGMDFFVPGIVVCLQRGRLGHAFGLTLLAVMIQEGTGSLAFGASILRYGGLIGLFVLGRSLLEPRSPVFIVLLALTFTLIHVITLKTMASLQSMHVPLQQLAWDGTFLFATFLLGWWLLDGLYRFFFRHESLA